MESTPKTHAMSDSDESAWFVVAARIWIILMLSLVSGACADATSSDDDDDSPLISDNVGVVGSSGDDNADVLAEYVGGSMTFEPIGDMPDESVISTEGTDESVDPMRPPEPPNADAIEAYLEAVARLPSEAPSTTESDDVREGREGDYYCRTVSMSETSRQDQLVAYQANAESLWPGAFVGGAAILDGLLTPVVLDRKPLTFSVSLENLEGDTFRTMEAPSLSAYRAAISDILSSEITGATPGMVYSEITQINSEEHLNAQLGVNVSNLRGRLATNLAFSNETVRSRFLINFVQAYYTVDLDPPTRPADFFADHVTAADVGRAFGGDSGGAPLYVSSITYGRRIMFTATSELSATEMRAALEFGYNAAAVDVSGSTEVSHEERFESMSIQGFVIGGSGEDAVQILNEGIVGKAALQNILVQGGNYSRESPGAPIAYKLAHLRDYSAARLSYTTDYDVQECERVSQRVQVTLQSIENTGRGGSGNVRMYGKVAVWSSDPDGMGGQGPEDREWILWQQGSGSHVTIDHRGTLTGEDGLRTEIIDVNPSEGHEIRFNVRLRDKRTFGSDDTAETGSRGYPLPFEQGWRHECGAQENGLVVPVSGGNLSFNVRFCLKPVL